MHGFTQRKRSWAIGDSMCLIYNGVNTDNIPSRVLDLIIHFHPSENCGWDLKISESDIDLIIREFPYLDTYKKDEQHMAEMKTEMSLEHSHIYYKYMYENIKEENGIMYDKIQELARSV